MAEKRNVTVQDIADFCGLARGTVSMALRDDERIAVKTRERVQKAAAELGYDPNLNVAARRLSLARHGRRVENRVVAITVNSDLFDVPYFQSLVKGAWTTLRENHFAALLMTPEDVGEESLEPLVRGEIDGLICCGHASLISVLRQLRQRRGFGDRPMVSTIHPSSDTPSVLADEARGVRQAVTRLLALGHRHILRTYAAYSDRSGADVPARREATAGCLVKQGLSLDEHLHFAPIPMRWMDPIHARKRLTTDSPDPADAPLLAYLQAYPRITAIMANNDAIAIYIYAALRDAGLDVPGRYSLVGFDDTDRIPDGQGGNLLSSIALPLEAIGATAARMVVSAVRGKETALKTTILPSHYEERGSVAAPAV